MPNEQDVLEVVDEITDDLDPNRIEDEAERLGIEPLALLDRVFTEAKARLTGLAE